MEAKIANVTIREEWEGGNISFTHRFPTSYWEISHREARKLARLLCKMTDKKGESHAPATGPG